MPTHGSITKAGKVRSQTPKIQAMERTSVMPRIRARKNAQKRITLGRRPGQNWMGERGRRRR